MPNLGEGKCTAGTDADCAEGGCCALIYLSGLSNLGPAADQVKQVLKSSGMEEGSNYKCMTKDVKEKFEKDSGGMVNLSE